MSFDVAKFNSLRKKQIGASIAPQKSGDFSLEKFQELREQNLKEKEKELDSKLSPREKKLKTQESRLEENYGAIQSDTYQAASKAQSALQSAGGRLTSLDQIARDFNGLSFSDYGNMLNYSSALSDADRRAIYNLNKDRIAAIDNEIKAIEEKAAKNVAKGVSADAAIAKMKDSFSTEALSAVRQGKTVSEKELSEYTLSEEERNNLKLLRETRDALVSANETYAKYGNAASLSYDELNKLRDVADKTDNDAFMHYQTLADNALTTAKMKKLSETKMEGTGKSVLDEAMAVAALEDGEEKDKRIGKLEEAFKKAGVDFDNWYSIITEDNNVSAGNFLDWMGNALETGFLQGNSGIWGFLDMSLGGVLKGMGWEDNPLSTANKYFKNQAERAAYDLQRSEARMGNGDALKLGGEFISGMAGALPHAAQAYLQKYLPGAATPTTIASTAALNNASAGAKALMTAQNLISNPMWGTSFAQEAGGTWNEAKSAGASDLAAGVEALLSGGINATIETGLTGNSGIQGVMQNAAKGDNLLKIIGSAFIDEAAEEVLQGTVSRALGKMHGSKEEVFDLEAMAKEAAMGGAIGGVLGGLQGGIDYAGKAYANHNAAKSAKEAFRTLTETESAVVDKILEAEVKEKEKGGKKLSEKQKTELRDKIIERMDRGEITVEEIENALGGETKSALDKLNEKEAKEKAELAEHYEGEDLKKRLEAYDSDSKKKELQAQLSDEVYNLVADSRLSETYNEQARKAVNFSISEEELAKIDEKRRPAYIRAMEEGRLNNTRAAHEILDLTSKIEADKGIKIDLTDTESLNKLGYTLKDVVVNGVATADGISVNIKSPKVLNTVVGHDLVHVLKADPKQFESLKKIAFDLAKTKGEYDSRWEEVDSLYKDKDGYKGDVEKIKEELVADLVGDYLFSGHEFIRNLSVKDRNLFQRIFDEIKYLLKLATAGSAEARQLEKLKKTFEDVYQGDVTLPAETKAQSTLSEIGVEVDEKTKTVYSLSSLNEAFNVEKGVDEYVRAREEYEQALAKSIAEDPDNVTKEELDKAKRYLDSLFLIGETIAKDRDRLDYEAAVKKSAWVSNAEYGGSIDFSTLCAKRRVFTGTFDAIQEALPDTVLTENDFLTIRNLLLESGEEAPCSMCYVEGSRAKHGLQVAKFLTEYLKTNPDWKPQIADFASASRLEQTRLRHPEAYAKYQEAMNKLAQSKPKEASVRTDYKGEILKAFINSKDEVDAASVLLKNLNGGIRFNSFSDFEIIHALDCMQVLMDMSRVGLSGQAYTKVKDFAESFGDTGLKINLSLVAKGVDENGNLLFDEINGMKHSDAIDLRNRYSENVGTVIVVFDEAQMKAALADPQIDYVLPFHRSQWKRAQYDAMGLPSSTKDFTAYQNDKVKNPKTGKWVNLGKIKHVATYTNDLTGETHKITGNIMPNQYWDYNSDGRTNAQRYLDYINSNGLAPKFRFLLDNVDGKWVLPEGEVGDNYFKLLIDFKMYNNEGWGSPQTPVAPEYNMPHIQHMLETYEGGHNVFPVAQDVVKEFVDGKKSGKYKAYPETFTPKRVAPRVNLPGTIAAPTFSLSKNGAEQKRYGDLNITGEDVALQTAEAAPEEISPVRKTSVPPRSGAEAVGLPYSPRYGRDASVQATSEPAVEPVAEPMTEKRAVKYNAPKPIPGTSITIAPENGNTNVPTNGEERRWYGTSSESEAVNGFVKPEDIPDEYRYYQVLSNKKTLERANEFLDNNGYDSSLEFFKNKMKDKSVSVKDIVIGERLLQEAVKKGDSKTATELMIDISILGTELGQKVQALSIIRRLSPEGQLMALTKVIERGKSNEKTAKIFKGVELTAEMQNILNSVRNEDGSYDQEALNAAVEKVKTMIAEQMKVTAWDVLDNWRYLSMLGNLKTHIRNIYSNAAGFAMRVMKNAVQRTSEDLFAKSLESMKKQIPVKKTIDAPTQSNVVQNEVIQNGTRVKAKDRDNFGTVVGYNPATEEYAVRFVSKSGTTATVNLNRSIVEPLTKAKRNKANPVGSKTNTDENMGPYHVRTRTWARPTSVVKEFAKKTTLEEKEAIAGNGKYSDLQDIKNKRKIFRGVFSPIQAVSDFNSKALEVEDAWFSRPTYRFALAEYLTANGIKTQEDIDNNPELIQKGKRFALEEALRATFRQDSEIANIISNLERSGKVAKIAVGAVMPFKKTPINIAKTGVAYSPIGFAKGLYDAVVSAKSKGEKVDMVKAIDEMAQGLTGTSLALLGYALASMRVLNGAGEDDKEASYDYQLGEQSYSITIAGDTFSLSWLTPVSMPMFAGANAYEFLVEEQEINPNVVIDALTKTLDPLTELSFISGLTDAISSYSDDSSGKISGMASASVANYVTQYFPTLLSQTATLFDDTKRSTKPSKDSGFTFGEELVNKIAQKVPLWRNTLEPSTDIWGNEIKQADSWIERFAQSFVHPWNTKDNIATEVDDELKDLYNQTGEGGVLPSIPKNYTNYEGVKYEMSAAEHTEYKQIYGQTAYEMISKLFKTDTYKNGDNKLRQSMVEAVYDYAGETARVQFLKGRDVDYTNAKDDKGNAYYKENAILGAIKNDMTTAEYTFYEKYPKKYKFLEDSGISYKAYEDADETLKRGYSWAYENQGKYEASKLITDDFSEFYAYKSDLNKISAGDQTKAQKIAYISSLDLDAAGKMILFRMEYPKDDSYNKQIVSYVNASGLTYSEKVAVLNGLGFSVGANNAISW